MWQSRAVDERGFSLVEMVIALALLTLVIAACLYADMQGLQVSAGNNQRVVAAGIVSGVLEKLSAVALTPAGFASIPITTQNLPSQIVSGTTYQLTQTTEWVNRGVSSSVCNSGTNSSLILRASVQASWGSAGQLVSEATLMSPPNGSFSPNEGSLAVRLTSSTAGVGFLGATVTATAAPPNDATYTITTGSDGCAFFAQLAQGNYTVSVSSPGGVDSKEQGPSVQTASVSAGSVSTVALNFDTGGTVDWSFAPASPTPALGLPIGIGNSSQGLTDNLYSYTNPDPTATSGSLAPVYPDAYDVFAGACTDADPDGLNKSQQPFYPSSTYPNLGSNVLVTPNGSTTSTVALYPLDISVYSAGGTLLSGASSPANSAPTAVAGASSLSGGGACPGMPPTYTLTPVAAGTSSSGVGLGHLQISVTVVSGGTTLRGSANVWVMPNGVYDVDANGNATTLAYSFSSPGSVHITVQ